jgi:hypothetical protein
MDIIHSLFKFPSAVEKAEIKRPWETWKPPMAFTLKSVSLQWYRADPHLFFVPAPPIPNPKPQNLFHLNPFSERY